MLDDGDWLELGLLETLALGEPLGDAEGEGLADEDREGLALGDRLALGLELISGSSAFSRMFSVTSSSWVTNRDVSSSRITTS